MTVLEKERANTGSRTAECVSGRITNWIGLRLDDAATYAALWQIVHQRLADQVPRQCDRILGQFRAAETPDAKGNLRLGFAHHPPIPYAPVFDFGYAAARTSVHQPDTGVGLGMRDMTLEGSNETKQATLVNV